MNINEATYEITTSQYDYGVPIVFDAGKDEGFQINDKIAFVFDTDAISDKTYTVNAEDFSFNLEFSKAEADALFSTDVKNDRQIRYSAKRYKDDQFLETLVDSVLIVKGTVKFNG